MKQSYGGGALLEELTCAKQLSRFFPLVVPVRMTVQVTAQRNGAAAMRETAVIEFCGQEHAIFVSSLPLEFDDRLSLQRDAREGAQEASVVAVQYHEGRKAVAVRFLQSACDWVT